MTNHTDHFLPALQLLPVQLAGEPLEQMQVMLAGVEREAAMGKLEPADEAAHMVALAGGQQALDQQIATAEQHGEHQWALQLSDYALRAKPDDAQAKAARIAGS